MSIEIYKMSPHILNKHPRYAENLDSGFVAPDAYGTTNISCHKNSVPGTLTASVSAGGSITFQWPATWPHPYGPVLTYVASCNGDCAKADKSTLSWVKIDASGIDYTTQKWASQVLIDQAGKWTTKVPSSLKAGNYVFRHEIIAYVVFLFLGINAGSPLLR